VKHPRPPATPAPTTAPAASSNKPTTTTPAKPALGAKPLPSRPFTPPAVLPKTPTVTTTPITEAQLVDIALGKTTFAEAMGMTRQEAFGLAQGAYRFFEFGQRERGLAIMQMLVELNPKTAAFHALLGAMQGRLGDEKAAAESYSRAIALEPANLSARVNRAELYLKQGVLDAALDDLLAATKADPQQKTALGKRAWRLARTTSSALKELIARAKAAPAKAASSSAKGPPPRR
jgi:predicted Zn-dependent protease